MADEMKLKYTTEVDTSGAVKGMADVEKVVGNTGKKAEGTGKSLKGMVQEMAPAKLKAFINPMAAATAAIGALSYGAVQATKDFAKFQSQLSKVNTLLKVSKGELNKYGEEILRVSRVTGMAKEQIGEGLYQALSAGVSSEDSMKFMEIATKTAIAGFTDVNTAVDGLTTVLNAYKMETKDTAKVADMFLATQNAGKTTVDELGKSIADIAPIAYNMGVSFEQVMATFSTMTAQGTKTSVVATQLKQAISQLSNSTTEAGKTFEMLAGKSFKQFMQEGGNISDAFQMLINYSDSSGVSLSKLTGSVEAMGAVLGIAGANAQNYNRDLKNLRTSAGEVEAAYKTATDNIEGDWSKLMTAMDTVWKRTVSAWEMPLRKLIQMATEFVNGGPGESWQSYIQRRKGDPVSVTGGIAYGATRPQNAQPQQISNDVLMKQGQYYDAYGKAMANRDWSTGTSPVSTGGTSGGTSGGSVAPVETPEQKVAEIVRENELREEEEQRHVDAMIAEQQRALEAYNDKINTEQKLKEDNAEYQREYAAQMLQTENIMAQGLADVGNLLISGQIDSLKDLTQYLTGKLLLTVSEAAGTLSTEALVMQGKAAAAAARHDYATATLAQKAAMVNWANVAKVTAIKMVGGIGQAMMSTASTSSGSGGSSGGGGYNGTTSTDKSEIAKEDDKEKFLEINTDRRDILAALLPDLDQAMKDGYNIRLIPKS